MTLRKMFFRFLRVGDATFGDHYEENVIKLVNINERKTSNFLGYFKTTIT